MNIIAVHGLKGGVGTTTVVANLAAAIHAQEQPVLAIDLCDQNSLRLHLGMTLTDESGFAVQVERQLPWINAAYENHQGIAFLPYGQDSHHRCVGALNRLAARDPQFLKHWLEQLDMPQDTWVLLDCPVAPSPLNGIGRELADLTLLVINPEAMMYAKLHSGSYLRQMQIDHRLNNLLLLNRYCPAFDLDKDITSMLKNDFAQNLIPITVHRDEFVREALAYKKTVVEFAPGAQSAQDFSLISLWLTARQTRLAQRAKQ